MRLDAGAVLGLLPLDDEAFPAVRLARQVGAAGGTYPAVYNAANEVGVDAFHDGQIGFLDIVDTVARVVDEHQGSESAALSVEGCAGRRPGPALAHGRCWVCRTWTPSLASQPTQEPQPTQPTQRRSGRSGRSRRGGRLMMYLLGVLFVAFGIGASIALHEIGHLVPAKRFGVKVTQYMVGFGPTLWSRHRGETEYGVKAIPLGGYIRMIGMFPPRPGDDPDTLRVSSTGRFSQLMDEGAPGQPRGGPAGRRAPRLRKLSVPKKLTVMLGGPVMNLIIATVLFGGIFTLYGLPEVTTKLSSVSECVDVKQAGEHSRRVHPGHARGAGQRRGAAAR